MEVIRINIIVVITLAFLSCCPKQERKVSVQNLNYCTLDEDFLITDPLSFIQNYDSAEVIGILKSDFLEHKKGEEFVLGHIETSNLALTKSGVGVTIPWEKCTYNSKGLLTNQKISSCYDWNVRSTYLTTDNYLKVVTDLEGFDPIYKYSSYFWLDPNKRIVLINRIRYGDLLLEYETQKIYYNDMDIIPSKIEFERKSQKGIFKNRGIAYFYKSENGLDSITVDFTQNIDYEPYLQPKVSRKYHFKNGLLRSSNGNNKEFRYNYYQKSSKP